MIRNGGPLVWAFCGLRGVIPLWGVARTASFPLPRFSIDPASPAVDGTITPDDVLGSGPAVAVPGATLGLESDFFGGFFDNLNSLSFGADPISNPLFFSVDRVSVGLLGSAVHAEARPGAEEAAGDLYQSLHPGGGNALQGSSPRIEDHRYLR